MVGELFLERRDPGLGALHLLLHPGQLARAGEQLLRLGLLVAGHLHQQRALLQHGRRVARGEHARHGRRPGVLERGGGVLRHVRLRLPELAGNQNAETRQLGVAASQLANAEQQVQRTEAGIAALKKQLADHKNSLGKLIDTQKATLASLTVPQQQTVQANTIGAGGTTTATYTGPTLTQAGKAVAFAYAQLGKPYQWGATGPGSYDCSGLVQAAWAAAGVSIPRTTYAQWAALPHISTSALEPGDLLYFDGIGHVAMYVGGGYIIDAPQTGLNVQKIPLSGWYQSTLVGAARP